MNRNGMVRVSPGIYRRPGAGGGQPQQAMQAAQSQMQPQRAPQTPAQQAVGYYPEQRYGTWYGGPSAGGFNQHGGAAWGLSLPQPAAPQAQAQQMDRMGRFPQGDHGIWGEIGNTIQQIGQGEIQHPIRWLGGQPPQSGQWENAQGIRQTGIDPGFTMGNRFVPTQQSKGQRVSPGMYRDASGRLVRR